MVFQNVLYLDDDAWPHSGLSIGKSTFPDIVTASYISFTSNKGHLCHPIALFLFVILFRPWSVKRLITGSNFNKYLTNNFIDHPFTLLTFFSLVLPPIPFQI